jgi:putative transposase
MPAGAFCNFNVTFHPTSDWIVQQLREAVPLPCPYQYVLFDHDAKFGNQVATVLEVQRSRTSAHEHSWSLAKRSGRALGWQRASRTARPYHPAERISSRRLGRDYLAYYHQDRTHIGLNKNTPTERARRKTFSSAKRIVSTSRIDGLHHRYRWSEAP